MIPADTNLQTKSGSTLHPIGMGTWGLGEYSLFSPGTEAEAAVLRHGISLGENHIDTAEMYANGGAESVVGRAITSIDREELFIASKLWKDHVGRGMVRPAVEAMLERLNTSYIDMLYIHAPWFDAPWQEAIPQICGLIDEGLVRHFGVSNFNAERLQEVLNITRHPIAANQMHYSCLHQQEISEELKRLCQANKIELVAYMPLEKGEVIRHNKIRGVAERHNATNAQIAIAWLLARGALPIPKASKIEHMKQNALAASIKLDAEEISYLTDLDSVQD